jgi:hypothetical protein
MVAMKALLLRVGIDKGCGGTLAPILDDGSFEFVPIPESVPAPGASTYNDRIGSIKNAPKVKGKRKKGGKTPPRRLQRAPSP